MSCPHHDNDVADGVSQQTQKVSHRLLRLWPRQWCRDCRQAASADRRIASGLTQIQGETLSGRSLDRLLDVLGLPALPELSETARGCLKAQLRRLLALIGILLFVTTLTQPELIGQKAIETLWFGKVQPGVLQTAGMWLLFGLGWYGKPLLALLLPFLSPALSPRAFSDKTCLRWLTGSALLAACGWLLLDHIHLRGAMAVLVIAIGGLLAVASTVMGGALVEQGQRMGATGRLGALHAAAIFLARLAGAGAAGLLGTATLHLTAPFCAVLLAGFALLCWLAQDRSSEATKTVPAGLPEQKATVKETSVQETAVPHDWERQRRETWGALQALLQSRNVWGVAGIAFLIYIAPNFAALQHQENIRLGFSARAQDSLDFVGGACGLIGVGGYLWLCRRLSLQTLFIMGILCNAAGTLLYLGYHSLATALLIEGANGLLSALVFAMLFDLAIRAIPGRAAMLGYALFTGIIAFSSHLSNVFGSWLYVQAGWGFLQVVILSAGLSLPALAVVALLPATLLDRREGRIVVETLAGRGSSTGIPAIPTFESF